MSEILTFDKIKTEIESNYPTPIASVFRKYRISPEENLGGRHKELIDLFEVLIKFLCVVQLQEARQVIPNFRDRLPQGGKTLEFLKRPSLGGWVGLLRMLSTFEPGNVELPWTQQIRKWYMQGKHPENIETLRLFDHIEGINYATKTKTPHAEICNALVTYRNKHLAHAATMYQAELLKRLPLLEHILAYLLHSLDFLGEMHPFYTNKIELTPNDTWHVHHLRLVGVNEEPGGLECAHKLELSEIYLAPVGGEMLDIRPVHLGPFFIWRINEALKKPEIYVYNDAWRTKLEYLSYESGAYYYHKELHSDFQELLDLKLQPGIEEDVYRALSPEARAEQAETTFKQALVFLEKRQFEDALEAFELSAEYERRPKTFLEMAKVQHLLRDQQEAVLQTLQNCLDLDPANQEALDLQQTLLIPETEPAETTAVESRSEDLQDLRKHEHYPTFFHLLSPQALRPYAFLFWLGMLVVWFSGSSAVEYLTGHSDKVLLNGLQFVLAILVLLCIAVGRALFLRLRIPLSLQLDAMRLERFERWFRQQYRLIFGDITSSQNRYVYNYSPTSEKLFLIVSLLIILQGGVIGFVLCELHTVPVFFMVKRWLDNMIAVVFLGFFIFRYIFATTIFIYQFSQLSLKPMLTKINDEGFRAFSPLIVSNLLFIIAAFLTYLCLAYHEFTYPVRLDFVFLILGVIFFGAWSIGMPVMLRLAARASKSKAVMAYSQHIEKAFQAFLETPDAESLETYHWLLKHQNVIEEIPTWPLFWRETVFVVIGSNIVMIVATVWYILSRLGYWQTFVERLYRYVF